MGKNGLRTGVLLVIAASLFLVAACSSTPDNSRSGYPRTGDSPKYQQTTS